MTLSPFLLVTLAALTSVCGASRDEQLQALRPDQVWVHLDSPWREAPAGAEVREATAWAKLATFRAGGDFVWLTGLLIKQGDAVRVSQGDPVEVYRGHWEVEDSGTEVDYSLSFRTIGFRGSSPAKAGKQPVRAGGHTLYFLDQPFHLLSGLERGSFESALSQVSDGKVP
jgi:hypothetical protein